MVAVLGGFALTYSTVASIVKYPYSSLLAGGKSKFGFFATEEETMKEVATELGLERRTASALSYARHPLVYLVEAADDICYQIMDIEDAAKLHILSREEAQGLLSAFFSEEELREVQQGLRHIADPNEQTAYLRSKVINLLVEEAAGIFLDAEQAILAGTFSGSLIHHLEPRTRQPMRRVARRPMPASIGLARSSTSSSQGIVSSPPCWISSLRHSFTPTTSTARTLLSRVK